MPSYMEYYDLTYLPTRPARPIVSQLILRQIDGPWTTTVQALVDSGADRSMVPPSVIQPILNLCPTHHETMIGVSGYPIPVTSIQLKYRINGLTTAQDVIYIIAFGRQPLIGRDILNQVKTVLDGPPFDGPFPKLTMYPA